MNRKFILSIFLIAVISASFIQMDSTNAFSFSDIFSDDFLSDESIDDSDYLYDEDYSSNGNLMNDDSNGDYANGDYSDVDYANVDYSTNTEDNSINRFFFGDTVDIYFDGQRTMVSTNLDSSIQGSASNEILNYVSNNIMNSSSNVDTIKEGVREICRNYGSPNCTVNIDSIIGEDQIPILVWAQGKSMLPTIRDGQYVLVNKTQDIHVGDIVSVNSKEYGGIMKRVDKINGNNVYLVSDNKKTYYQKVDGVTYEYKGLCTWVDISEIEGVAIQY